MAIMSPLDFATQLAKGAGEILLQHYGTELTKKIKTGPTDYATNADLASEKYILEELQKHFPNDIIITEESGTHGQSGGEWTWIVDPLDGTHRFAQGESDFGVMISRAHRETIDMAVVYNPKKDILATGQKGEGAYLNGKHVDLSQLPDSPRKPLRVSIERDVRDILTKAGFDVASSGAIGNLMATLAGERGAFVSNNGFSWDFAPPALLLAEAGWHVTDFSGKPYAWDGKIVYRHPGIIAAPSKLHAEILAILHNHSV